MRHAAFSAVGTMSSATAIEKSEAVKSIRLHPYQANIIGAWRRSDEDTLISAPVGSGKSLMIVARLRLDLGGQFARAVIAAPQRQIEDGFADVQPAVVHWPSGAVAQRPVTIEKNFVMPAREAGRSRGEVRRYLRNPDPGYVQATTHSALSQLTADDLPADLSGSLLVLDEGHHAPEEGLRLSDFVRLWRARGGRLALATATPFRADGLTVHVDGMRQVRYSQAEHMATGMCPRRLESQIVCLSSTEDEAGSLSVDDVAAAFVERWLADGRPKTIVRLPPRGGTRGLVAAALDAFRRAGARCADASGVSSLKQKAFVELLAAERARSFAESKVDVIVGVQRVVEGTDWRHCSALYALDIPTSLAMTIQLAGRTLRAKGADHDPAHRDVSRITFFVTRRSDPDELSLDHSRHALLTAAFMTDHQLGAEWIVVRSVRRGLERALQELEGTEAADEAWAMSGEAHDANVRAEAQLALVAAYQLLVEEGSPATAAAIVDEALRLRHDLPADLVVQLASEVLATLPDSTAIDAADAIETGVAEGVLRRGRREAPVQPLVREAMREAFAEVLREFREVSLERSPVLAELGRQVHVLTGETALEFTRRLARARNDGPLSDEQILADRDAFFSSHDRDPDRNDGDVATRPGETWSGYEQALFKGHRGLQPPGRTLLQLFEKHRGSYNARNRPLTLALIRRRGAEFLAKHEQWPTKDTGQVEGEPIGETWARWEAALQQGLRGIRRPFPSLATLFTGGDPRKTNRALRLERWRSLPKVEELMKEFNGRTGGWPTETTVDPELRARTGETWRRLNTWLHVAHGLTLVALTRRIGGRNKNRPGPLDLVRLRREVLAYIAKREEKPTKGSGPIEGWPGEHWGNVDQVLKTKRRGTDVLPVPMSLSVFIRRFCEQGEILPDSAKERR